jgi:hypothetical protein
MGCYEYNDTRDRANALLERIEALAASGEPIETGWLMGEVCHLRGAYIDNHFVLERVDEDRIAAISRAEKAESAVASWKRTAETLTQALSARTRERDKARDWMVLRCRPRMCGCYENPEAPCACGARTALADEPSNDGAAQ